MKRGIVTFLITVVAILGIVLLVPMDFFRHGYYSEELDYSRIQSKLVGSYDLEEGPYELLFSPKKKHLVGFEINLVNQPRGNTGELILEVQSERGKVLDTIKVDLSKVEEATWYKTYTKAKLKKDKFYKLLVYAENAETIPHLQMIDRAYIGENVEGDLLIGYAYSEPTFSLQNKVMISLFILSIWMFLCTCFWNERKRKQVFRYLAGGIFITTLLSWNYMYNSMDNQNVLFTETLSGSEMLVKGVIDAEKNGIWFEEGEYGKGWSNQYVKFGLGTYEPHVSGITDEDWLEGYSRKYPAVLVSDSKHSRELAIPGHFIKFENDSVLKIEKAVDDGKNITIYLAANNLLTPHEYGDLKKAVYCDVNQNEVGYLNAGIAKPYVSQFGLQGKIFRHLSRYMHDDSLYPNLYLICSLALGGVVASIVLLLYAKYNMLLGNVFLVTFWLSPWVVSFARNLYWVEFTWFLPMAIGLFCAWKIESKIFRILSYGATFLAILGKCLCGYEYISNVMMGLISFLLVDFFVAVLNHDRRKSRLLFRTILIIGTVALAGFFVALCIHAPLKGDGSVLEGIKAIIKEDVLRRTSGGNLNELEPIYWMSVNASVWETFSKYFHFPTEIIIGVAGNLFPILCLIPLSIFAYEVRSRKLNYETVVMYFVFFLTSASWLCLAKGHSYIHTHMNYVLWYFGFIQICFYIILHKFWMTFRKKRKA